MDVALLAQVLINLLKNAIEAVPQDGSGEISVEVNSDAREQMARIAVVDNGVGMEPGLMRKIFIPFYTTKTKGTGIGLSLSRQIMSLHNGNITVQSVPGSGTVFTIEWRW
jgi:signal transduction histidine kinase